jgi:hypothetical protein
VVGLVLACIGEFWNTPRAATDALYDPRSHAIGCQPVGEAPAARWTRALRCDINPRQQKPPSWSKLSQARLEVVARVRIRARLPCAFRRRHNPDGHSDPKTAFAAENPPAIQRAQPLVRES